MRPAPSRDQLVRYVLGKSTPQEQKDIEALIKANPLLLDELDDINLENSDSLVRKLRNWFSGPRVPRVLSSTQRLNIDTKNFYSSNLIKSDFGEYRIAELISDKGGNSVFEAFERKSGRVVAIKLLRPCFNRDAKRVPNSSKELRLAGKLNHPNLVKITDSGEFNGIEFVVMERLEGFDVSQILSRTGPLPIPAACSILLQTSNALQYISERSMVHRDVKPSNIFLTSQGVVKLLDLGLIRDLSEEYTETLSGQLLGTIDYMAPEQAFDTHCVDIRSDIYSLGCTFFKLLTGEAPFAGGEYQHLLRKALAHASHQIPSVHDLRPDVPKQLEEAIQRMCAKNPNDRFSSPREVSTAVEAFCNGNDLVYLLQQLEVLGYPNRASDVSVQSEFFDNSKSKREISKRSKKDFSEILRTLGFSCCLLIAVLLYVFAANGGSSKKDAFEIDAPFRQMRNVFNGLSRYFVEGIKPQALELSPDGKFVAMCGTDGTLRVIFRETNETAFEVKNAKPSINNVSFSSDSRYMLACQRESGITVWETSGFSEAFVLQIPTCQIAIADFNHSVDTVIAADTSGLLHAWDLSSGKRVDYQLPDEGNPIECLSILADNQKVFTGHRNGECGLYDTQNGGLIRLFNGHSSQIRTVATYQNNDLALSGSEDKSVRLWNLTNGKEIAVFHGHEKPVLLVSFTADPDIILSADCGGRICFWNISNYRLVEIIENSPGILSPKMIRSCELATYDTATKFLTTWDLSSPGEGLGESITRPSPSKNSLNPIASKETSTTGSFRVDPAAERLFSDNSAGFAVQSLTLSDDEKLLFSGHRSGGVKVWNIETKEKVADFQDPNKLPQTIHSIAYHSKTGRLMSGGSPNSLLLWDYENPIVATDLPGHSAPIWSVVISKDGSRAVTGSWDGSVKIWDLMSQTLINSFELRSGKVFTVGYSPDEESIMVAGRGFVSRIDSKTGREQWTFRGHHHFINAISISPDGEKIAFGGRDNTVQVLNAKNGEQTHVMRGHAHWINDVAFSDDSRFILSAAADKTVRVWDCDTSIQRAVLNGHHDSVNSAIFLKGSKQVISGGADGNILLWRLNLEE